MSSQEFKVAGVCKLFKKEVSNLKLEAQSLGIDKLQAIKVKLEK